MFLNFWNFEHLHLSMELFIQTFSGYWLLLVYFWSLCYFLRHSHFGWINLYSRYHICHKHQFSRWYCFSLELEQTLRFKRIFFPSTGFIKLSPFLIDSRWRKNIRFYSSLWVCICQLQDSLSITFIFFFPYKRN